MNKTFGAITNPQALAELAMSEAINSMEANMNFRKAISARPTLLILILIALVAGCAGTAEQRQGGVERMYVLYCGEGNASDSSRWAPGVAAYVNKPFRLTNSCYLIKHAKGWML